MTDDTRKPKRRRLPPIVVTSANEPTQLSSLAALLLKMAARPRLRVVENEQSGCDLRPEQQG
jgi:hypothetical protein